MPIVPFRRPPAAWAAAAGRILLRAVPPCFVLLVGTGCGERRADAPRPPAAAATEAAMTAADDSAATAAALLAADRAFAADVAAAAGAARAEIWAAWFAADGRQLVPGAVIAGHDGIVGLMEPAFADPAFTLTWDPDLAAGGGGWGWTSGRYVSTREGADGPVRREGRYLTVWRRAADGAWKVAVDTGVPDGG